MEIELNKPLLNLKKIDDGKAAKGVIIDDKALKTLYKHALNLQGGEASQEHTDGFLSLVEALDEVYERNFGGLT
jgi:hypothetical protein